MFPVTLEFDNGDLLTTRPPCYGFLREEEYLEDSHSYFKGWNVHLTPYPRDSRTEPFGTSNLAYNGNYEGAISDVSCDVFDMKDLAVIWNSGSHLPTLGVAIGSGDLIAFQHHDQPITYSKEINKEPSPSLVETWASSRGKNVTMKDVMEAFEANIDHGRESVLRWHEKGFMGVSAEAECDRALFYLMLNRALHCKDYDYWAYQMLDDIYLNKIAPMVAFLVTRIVATQLHGVKKGEFMTNINNGDNCIFPSSLLWCGIGKQYETPTSVSWQQRPYCISEGHLREEDLPEYMFSCHGEEYEVSSSIFFAMAGLKETEQKRILLDKNTDKVADPLIQEFAKCVLTSTAYSRTSGTVHANGYKSSYYSEAAIDYIEHDSDLEIKHEGWKDLALSLIMGE